jgi:hypothetical protein
LICIIKAHRFFADPFMLWPNLHINYRGFHARILNLLVALVLIDNYNGRRNRINVMA